MKVIEPTKIQYECYLDENEIKTIEDTVEILEELHRIMVRKNCTDIKCEDYDGGEYVFGINSLTDLFCHLRYIMSMEYIVKNA